ncbi:MAG: adenylate/guanylate cyclase domain-containing protein [Stellaceae bacterium]
MDVGHWLRGLGLAQYEATFRENEIDAEVLLELTDTDFEKIGVPLGHRKRLLKAIASLGGTETAAKAATLTATASSTDAAERRQLTVMFCDLVGSTALSARLDPEDMRQVIRAYHDACSGVVARYDGFIAKFMGDGILAYFGFPYAHEDDAARAVHAGLEIAEVVGGLQTRAREKLAARIGVATGLVVVGDVVGHGAAQEQAVVGDSPNLAARLQALAEPDSVVIAASTRRLVGDIFRLRDLGRRAIKGLAEPVEAWAALGLSERESRFEATHAARLSGFVGREMESADLLARQRRAWVGQGQIVLISGEAGIGKSRLCAWLAEQVAGAPHTRVRYQCSPYHRDSALYPFVQQFERAAGIAPQENPGVKLEKLEKVLVLATDRLDEVAPLIASMLSIPLGDRYRPLGLSPAQQRRVTFSALLDQMEGLAKQKPVLILFEDAHWADATSLELLDLVIERVRRLPVLLLITFRPEFEAPWKGLPDVAEIVLGRFDRPEAERLVESVMDGRKLPAEVLSQVVTKTDGVPLFVEELTKSVLESGLLVEDGERYRLDGPLPPLAIPSTLQDSLMARLDRLASVKEIAQIGAAMGREFSHALLHAVAAVDETMLRSALVQLEDAKLVFRSGEPPDARYTFKHSLVRDTAYESLLRSRRQILHRRIAETLRDKFARIAETEPELLAYHFTEAGLAEPAIEYWLQAGKKAATRSANREAIMHFRRGLEGIAKLADRRLNDRLELDLQVALGPCLIATEGPLSDAAVANFSRARELCEQLGSPPEHQHVLHWLSVMHVVRGELHKGLEATETATELAETRGDRPALINSLRGEALVKLLIGRLEESRGRAERAIALFDAADAAQRLATRAAGQDAGVASLAVASWALWALGYPDSAVARIGAALERAGSIQHPHTQAYATYYASVLHALRGEWASSLQHAETCLALADTHGFAQWRGLSRIVRLIARSLLDSSSDTGDALLVELADHRRRGYQLGITAIYALALQSLALRGEYDATHKLIADGLTIVRGNDERLFEAEFHRIRAQLLIAEQGASARTEAKSQLICALATAQSQASRSIELRAAHDLAILWRHEGQREEARKVLEPIRDWFTEGFDTLDLKKAKVLLDELA